MLTKLEPRQYHRLLPLFANLRYNLVIDSIIAGNTPAWVYTDALEAPRLGLMWNRMDALLLGGEPGDGSANRALNALIREQIVPDARRRYIPELSLFCQPDIWEPYLGDVLDGLEPEIAWRRYYRFNRAGLDWRARVPSGCEILPINSGLLSDRGLENVDQLTGWVNSFWRSDRDFVENGFGFCLLHSGALASWCLSVYVHGADFELGLATHPDYRRRGYAALVAAASVEHCQSRGFTPHWHCWEENRPSIAIAEKVGFTDPVHYPVYRFQSQPLV